MAFYPAGGSSSGGGGLQPYQFAVETYGARGNGRIVTDGVMTSGSPNLACTTSVPFVTTDAGKSILVSTAAGAFAHLATTISSVTDSGHAVLAASATANTTGSPGAITYFGNDDTAAVQAAINAAVTYAQTHNGYAEVVFRAVTYIIAGAPVIGGATLGNAQLTLPVLLDPPQKVTLVLRGTLDQSALPHWLQTTPQAAGTVLACARTDGTVDVTFGPSCVIGGPFSGYGANSAGQNTWDNMCPVINGITVMVPYNGTYGGFDFFGVAEANVPNAAVMAAAVVPAGGPAPTMGTPGNISNFGWFGLRMPSWRNNANANIGLYSCEGLVNGIRPSEHTFWDSIRIINCFGGIVPYSGGGTLTDHYVYGAHSCVENCFNAVQSISLADGGCRIHLADLDEEVINNIVNDSPNVLVGYIGICGIVNITGSFAGGANLRIVNIQQPSGHLASPPAVPASTVAAVPVYKDASVVVHTGAGVTVSAITVDGTSTSQTVAAASSSVPISVSSGKTIALTYAGGTPTWDWWLS